MTVFNFIIPILNNAFLIIICCPACPLRCKILSQGEEPGFELSSDHERSQRGFLLWFQARNTEDQSLLVFQCCSSVYSLKERKGIYPLPCVCL